MSEKIVLIDGHSILNRAFYGVPELSNSEGLHTNAVLGFLNIMFKLLDVEKPDYLAVAFDVAAPTFRHEMYAEYKGTRKKMPDELLEQVPVVQDVLRAMGICVVTKEGLEADDILGTIAKTAEARGMQVALASGDRDLLQLASESVRIIMPKSGRGGSVMEEYRADDVFEKFGVAPAQIVDLKGLMGDASDNIPGVPGIGEKTAVKILAKFPTVEEAYGHIDEVEPKRARTLLMENRDKAFLSKRLAAIKTDCDIDYSFEAAKLGDIFTREAFEWLKKLELKSIIRRFKAFVPRTSDVGNEEKNYVYIRDRARAAEFIEEAAGASPDVIGISFIGNEKSDGLSFVGFAASFQKGEENVTACMLKQGELDGEFIIELYKKLAKKAPNIALIDLKNVMHLTAFRGAGADLRKKIFEGTADLAIAAYLLNPLKDSYAFDDISMDYLDIEMLSYADRFGKEAPDAVYAKAFGDLAGNEAKEAEQSLLECVADMARVSCMAYSPIMSRLKERGMYDLFRDIEMPTAYYLHQMEIIGIRVDKKALNDMSKMFGEKIDNLENDIYDLAGGEFNINSPKQLGYVLFEKLKLPFGKKTKTGYSTSAETLEKLREKDPIVPRILEYRQISKLKSTYADGLPAYIEDDGRIRGRFNQTVTATGRISSADPNLQNIPVRMESGRQLRKVFIPKDGCVFLDADYSQIELRVLAHMSGDEELIAAYRNGEDIHRITASKVFHTPFNEVTQLQRRSAKAVNFGIVYGISAFGLAKDLNISNKEADGIIKRYFETYPGIKSFLDSLVESAKEKGYAETMFGRKRPVPELKSKNFSQRSLGERIAMNSPIQGTAADIIKIAMIRVAERLDKNGLRSKIVLQVHDELLVEAYVEEKEEVGAIMLEEMRGAADLKVPLEADVKEGADWFEAH